MENQLGSEVIRLRIVKVYGIVCRVQFSGHGLENIISRDIRFRKNNSRKKHGMKNYLTCLYTVYILDIV